MKRTVVSAFLVITLTACLSSTVAAAPLGGWVSTDRFGYTGSVVRYGSLQDAESRTSPLGSTQISDRDLSLTIVDGAPTFGPDMNIIMGSWWYTTSNPYQGDGWGNTRGNSGTGFAQLYDSDSSTDTSVDMEFSGFDGTYWTTFTLLLTGANAGSADYARLWVDYQGLGADKVLFHSYTLALTATGLLGEQSGDTISASNHPSDVTGVFSGIFQNVSSTYPVNNGFYAFNFNLNMTNWAYENISSLTGPNSYNTFADSSFGVVQPVPEPTTLMLLGLGLAAAGRKLRRR